VLEAWRHDYNNERPHSKLGWMTPRAYASALGGESGRDAALRWAPRPGLLPPRKQKVQINPGLSFRLDEKRGSRHALCRFDGGAVRVERVERMVIDVSPEHAEPIVIEGEVLEPEPEDLAAIAAEEESE
jgi:hypothetical protein